MSLLGQLAALKNIKFNPSVFKPEFSRMSPAVNLWRNAAYGAATGGILGGLNNEGTTYGGALKGAFYGAMGGSILGVGGRSALRAYGRGTGMSGFGRYFAQGNMISGRNAFMGLQAKARQASNYIGATNWRAFNPIKGMFR